MTKHPSQSTAILPCDHCAATGLVRGEATIKCALCEGTGRVLGTVCLCCDGQGVNHVSTDVLCPHCGGMGAVCELAWPTSAR